MLEAKVPMAVWEGIVRKQLAGKVLAALRELALEKTTPVSGFQGGYSQTTRSHCGAGNTYNLADQTCSGNRPKTRHQVNAKSHQPIESEIVDLRGSITRTVQRFLNEVLL